MLTRIGEIAQGALGLPGPYGGPGGPGAEESALDIAMRGRGRAALSMAESAVAEGRACLAYQPVMQAAASGRTAFHEGLIRIQDEAGRIIPARDFIGAVEDREVGRRIDVLALRLGLAELRARPDLRLSINLSARSIGYRAWGEALDAGLRADPTVAERLILEITESSAMAMPELVISFMADLSDRGISFALDDFGAGMTSFRYLRDFYFDIMKIDGSFVSRIDESPDDRALVAAMVSVARHFEMFVVAERVERAEEVRVLMDLGVDCMQGYYFGAPSITPPWRADARRAARSA